MSHGLPVRALPLLLAALAASACNSQTQNALEVVAVASVENDDLVEDVHAGLFRNDLYPSARQCQPCHEEIFAEWSSSAHAYSGISPMFHRFEQALNTLAQGTVAAFCVRCHLPVGTAAGQPRHMTVYDRAEDLERFDDPRVAIEGVTCIACHRVSESYGRVNGSRRIEPGTMFEPMYGKGDGPGLADVTANPDKYGVATEPGQEGIRVHRTVTRNDDLGKSEFCMSCHQVAVHPGIKLEVVWDQYLDSPAYEKDVSCQDCHMGKNPGKYEDGYELAHRARVAGEDLGELLPHGDHAFVGPGYSIAHPGIFPHHPTALRHPGDPDAGGFSLLEWMTFDWRAGWGTAQFEQDLADGKLQVEFPEVWKDRPARSVARRIVDENLASLDKRKERRRQVMENGSKIDGPFFAVEPAAGQALSFHYDVTNTCEGHNLPSGSLGAQPQVWLNVALVDPDGKNIWESGYLDEQGDLADHHSAQVLAGELELDRQLFNLQTKFLTTNLKGTDREMYLPVPFDQDQLPFIRPAGLPVTVLNHPPFIRMEQRSIPPLTTRKAKYEVPAELLQKPGTYRLAVRMRSRAEPIYFMRFVGSSDEMIRVMNDRMVDIHPYTVEFEVR
ncbi:MAG: cytochrome C [Planctomycetaceae bacterium]|nr:cytochrome C [Planctomycetaceae bacterium]